MRNAFRSATRRYGRLFRSMIQLLRTTVLVNTSPTAFVRRSHPAVTLAP